MAVQPDPLPSSAQDAKTTSADICRGLYLNLLKRTLLGLTYEDESNLYPEFLGAPSRRAPHDTARRMRGGDWPAVAPTMIGIPRLDNIQNCIENVLKDSVPGDLIETGVWRGGAVIFMRGVLKAYGVTDRTVWVADSFEGLPPPNPGKYPADALMHLEQYRELAVPMEEVQRNFKRYELLDNQVRFLKGWFRDSLPKAPIEKLAVLRLDGDLYESTMDGLANLYRRVSPGGYVIVDDYYVDACRKAVHDFRDAHGIQDPIDMIDEQGAFWRRAG